MGKRPSWCHHCTYNVFFLCLSVFCLCCPILLLYFSFSVLLLFSFRLTIFCTCCLILILSFSLFVPCLLSVILSLSLRFHSLPFVVCFLTFYVRCLSLSLVLLWVFSGFFCFLFFGLLPLMVFSSLFFFVYVFIYVSFCSFVSKLFASFSFIFLFPLCCSVVILVRTNPDPVLLANSTHLQRRPELEICTVCVHFNLMHKIKQESALSFTSFCFVLFLIKMRNKNSFINILQTVALNEKMIRIT